MSTQNGKDTRNFPPPVIAITPYPPHLQGALPFFCCGKHSSPAAMKKCTPSLWIDDWEESFLHSTEGSRPST